MRADATYSAGSNMLDNLSRDIGTYLNPGHGSSNDQLKAALGSYVLTATVVRVNEACRSAKVHYEGFNQIDLGSALGFKNETLTIVLNVFALTMPGPFVKPVNQHFSLYETIYY